MKPECQPGSLRNCSCFAFTRVYKSCFNRSPFQFQALNSRPKNLISFLVILETFLQNTKNNQKLAPKKKARYTRSNPDPDLPAIFENPNLTTKTLRKQEHLKPFANSHFETPQQSPTTSEFSPVRVAPLSINITASPSPSSTSHSILSTRSSSAHISTTVPVVPAVSFLPVIPFIYVNMANRYAPLQLLGNPGAMPQNYQSRITYFDGTSSYTALQHTKKMQDYFENYEIDNDDVRMKIFVQSLTGDVRIWFRALAANSIANLDALYQTFLNIWEKKKDPLHILSEYNTIKRGPQETVLDYYARFNNVYNAIPKILNLHMIWL